MSGCRSTPRGMCLAPLDQFKTNPIVKDMANRRLLDTTFIFSGLGGETGPVVIDNIWSVIDMGENNRLFSYNGADTWYLSENREATIADLEGGGGFEEDKLLDELPAATILDKFIHEPAYEDITAHSITMSWDAHEDAAAYRVEIYQSVGTSAGIKYKLISDKTLDGTSATMGGLDPLTWYFAVVHVLDEEGGITGTYPNPCFSRRRMSRTIRITRTIRTTRITRIIPTGPSRIRTPAPASPPGFAACRMLSARSG